MTKLLKTAVLVYQKTFGLVLPQSCRFYPSCSNYALDALDQHGPWKGIFLIFKRLIRCHPFHAGGVDFVPGASQKKFKKRSKRLSLGD